MPSLSLPRDWSKTAVATLWRLARLTPIIILLLALLGAIWLVARPARLPSPQELQRRNGIDLERIEAYVKTLEDRQPVDPITLRNPFQAPSLTTE